MQLVREPVELSDTEAARIPRKHAEVREQQTDPLHGRDGHRDSGRHGGLELLARVVRRARSRIRHGRHRQRQPARVGASVHGSV